MLSPHFMNLSLTRDIGLMQTYPKHYTGSIITDHSKQNKYVVLQLSFTQCISLKGRDDSSVEAKKQLEGQVRNPIIRYPPLPDHERKILMQRLKPVFSLISDSSARNITTVPRELQPRAQKNQAAKLWLPLLQRAFGSLENFLQVFWQTSAGHEALDHLLASKQVDDLVMKNIDRFVEAYVRQYKKECEAILAENSTKAAKGLPHSNSTCQKEKMALYHETKSEATVSMEAKMQKRRALLLQDQDKFFAKLLPKGLRRAPQLQSLIVSAVLSSGGGWTLNWRETDWVEAILNRYSANFFRNPECLLKNFIK